MKTELDNKKEEDMDPGEKATKASNDAEEKKAKDTLKAEQDIKDAKNNVSGEDWTEHMPVKYFNDKPAKKTGIWE